MYGDQKDCCVLFPLGDHPIKTGDDERAVNEKITAMELEGWRLLDIQCLGCGVLVLHFRDRLLFSEGYRG